MQNQCMCTYRDVISNIDFAAQNGGVATNGDIVANLYIHFVKMVRRPMVTPGLMEQFSPIFTL